MFPAQAAADGGDACLDAKLAAGVAVHHVAAAACGVPSWRKVPGEWGDDYGPVERGGALWFASAAPQSSTAAGKGHLCGNQIFNPTSM